MQFSNRSQREQQNGKMLCKANCFTNPVRTPSYGRNGLRQRTQNHISSLIINKHDSFPQVLGYSMTYITKTLVILTQISQICIRFVHRFNLERCFSFNYKFPLSTPTCFSSALNNCSCHAEAFRHPISVLRLSCYSFRFYTQVIMSFANKQIFI